MCNQPATVTSLHLSSLSLCRASQDERRARNTKPKAWWVLDPTHAMFHFHHQSLLHRSRTSGAWTCGADPPFTAAGWKAKPACLLATRDHSLHSTLFGESAVDAGVVARCPFVNTKMTCKPCCLKASALVGKACDLTPAMPVPDLNL